VYPALAAHNALVTERPQVETLWVGGEGGMEAGLVQRAGIPFRTIPAAGLHGVGWRAMPGNALKLARGYAASRRILREFKPDALFFTGGYLAVPMALAGRRIPILLYVPDVEPALAMRTLVPFADRIAVTAPDSLRYYPKRAALVQTGYPVRADLLAWTREQACETLNLHQDKPVLMIWGGSRGARSINQAVVSCLPHLLELAQVIHVSGELDWPMVESTRDALLGSHRRDYHAFAYLHEEMGAALRAADLVISRAGASVLGEYPVLGLPSILVPYPYAWRYQKVNAEALAAKGAAIVLDDSRLKTDLLTVIRTLLNEPAKLNAMRAAATSLARPNAARTIASQILELAGEERL